jgi:hypothetical protein
MKYDYHITKKDELDILRVFLEYDGLCDINDLARALHYNAFLSEKKRKAKRVMKKLEKRLQKSVQAKIIQIGNRTYALIY